MPFYATLAQVVALSHLGSEQIQLFVICD